MKLQTARGRVALKGERIIIQAHCDWWRWWRDGFNQLTICEISTNKSTTSEARQRYITVEFLGLGLFLVV